MNELILRVLSFISIALHFVGGADAQPSSSKSSLAFYDPDQIISCAATADENPPDFFTPHCTPVAAHEVDPQDQLIWMRTIVPLQAVTGANGEPLSVYVSGKMSSIAYLNGVLIGQNGRPGTSADNEQVGKMDAQFFPPQDLFQVGDNEVVLLASSHRGFLHLSHPFHMVAIAPAGHLAATASAKSGLALITLGVFLLSGIYFGVMTLMGTARLRFATLSAISLFAAGQLISEILRSLVAYDYPIHDLRLMAITVFSGAFGLTVTFHILRTFKAAHLRPMMMGLIALCLLCAVIIPGFDYKALSVMTLPLLASLVMIGLWTWQRRARAFGYFLSLVLFIGAVFLFRALFLDSVFFLLVAFFLLLLFVDQAMTLTEEARERRSNEARANRLEQALAAAEERTEASHIDVKSAGKIERIATTDIIHCKGSGGYCELALSNGRTVLHTATLNEMEETLPATFLRVHRSHLINVMFIKSLMRDPAGTGTLTLTQGTDIPVSRRIMPKVRQALG